MNKVPIKVFQVFKQGPEWFEPRGHAYFTRKLAQDYADKLNSTKDDKSVFDRLSTYIVEDITVSDEDQNE